MEKTIVTLCNKYLNGQDALNNHTFERVHRLGPVSKNKCMHYITIILYFGKLQCGKNYSDFMQ